MNPRILSTIVLKDLRLFFKNRFFALITVLGLVAYAVIYLLLPRQVDEMLEIGLVAPALPSTFSDQLQEEGLILQVKDSEDALKESVANGDLLVGIVLPDDLLPVLMSGEKARAHIFFSAELPEEMRDIYPLLVEEWISMIGGQSLAIETTTEVLGPDMAGEQIPVRDRMLPLFAIFVLMMETMGLASLISSEVVGGTLHALLVTPLRVEGLFLGKGITGVGLAFSETAALMAVTGGLNHHPLLVLTILLLGAVMVTGISFLVGAVSKDMMSVMGWGILVLLLLAIPSFNVLLPGLTSDWIQILPSYYLVDAIHRVENFEAGWTEVIGDLLTLVTFSGAFLVLGIGALRRRLR
jgi:ABC-2 type transport system permease protein